MKIGWLYTLTTLACLTIVTKSSNIVISRRCPKEYDTLGEYIVFETPIPHQEAITLCKNHNGKLGIPADQLSWRSLTNHLQKSIWIGVHFEKYNETKIKATTSDGQSITNVQRALLDIDDDAILQKLEDTRKTCLIFSPTSKESTNWVLESCGDPGVIPRAGALCQCVSDIAEKEDRSTTVWSTNAKDTDESKDLEFVEANSQAQNTESGNSTETKLIPRKREGVQIELEKNDEDEQSSNHQLSTPLGLIVGALVVCCLIGTTYYISKRQGWNIGEMVSRRMPYNRPRVPELESVNQAQTEQEMVDIGFPNDRQIHVYEEIIPRNLASHTPRDVLLSRSSAITIPQEPPPEPPNAFDFQNTATNTQDEHRKVLEDGYMKPSFRRGDTIPGDVRSPPPVVSTIFSFSAPSTHCKKKNILPEKEIKYASVETIHTAVDESINHDEEYFTKEYDDNEMSNSENTRALIVELPESTREDFDRDINSYVPINGTLPSKTTEAFRQPDDIFSPVFPIAKNEYENGRFLSKVVKMPPGAKPKRRNIERTSPHLREQENESAVYSRIPSASNEPIYSKIMKTNNRGRGQSTSSRESGGYTPMKRKDTIMMDEEGGVDTTTVEYDLPPEDNLT